MVEIEKDIRNAGKGDAQIYKSIFE